MLSVQTNGIMYLKTKSQDTLLFVITVTVLFHKIDKSEHIEFSLGKQSVVCVFTHTTDYWTNLNVSMTRF